VGPSICGAKPQAVKKKEFVPCNMKQIDFDVTRREHYRNIDHVTGVRPTTQRIINIAHLIVLIVLSSGPSSPISLVSHHFFQLALSLDHCTSIFK
jgi:hypothetical protein